jgi:acyl-coenzyme A synthetase/AMP-(fatty) acid ligase
MPQDQTEIYDVVSERNGYKLVCTGYDTYPMNKELAMLLTTSGSTGSPKLVRHKYSNLSSNAKNVASIFEFTAEDRALIDLQLHYTMGLNVACSNLYAGATLMMTTYNILEKGYWDFFDNSRITNICGVPYSFEMLKRIKFFKKEYPSLRVIAEGGGKLTDDLFEEIAEYADNNGKKFYATFGTSETTARLAFLEPEKALEKIGSIGKAIPEGKLFLVDDAGDEITNMEATGELVYTGPNVTIGYALCKEDLLKGDERNGVYYTGDVARRDKEGFYFIVGRKSRFLKLFGHRVGLDETERIIKSEYQIECACAGNDKVMKIYITTPELADEIKHFISKKTRIQISAFKVIVLNTIPKNEVGKVMYNELEQT